MGDGRPVLDDEDAAALHGRRVVEPDRRRGAHDDRRLRIEGAQRLFGEFDVGAGAAVDLVDDQHVGHAGDGFAGMVGRDLPRAQRIGDRDMQIRPDEGKIVVAAVPDDDVGFAPRPSRRIAA